jgi:hypothetical protein
VLYLKVSPSRLPDPAAFAGLAFDQVKSREAYLGQILKTRDLQGAVATLHAYAQAEPFWIIEVFQQGSSYRHVAWTAAEILTAFGADLAALGEAPAP